MRPREICEYSSCRAKHAQTSGHRLGISRRHHHTAARDTQGRSGNNKSACDSSNTSRPTAPTVRDPMLDINRNIRRLNKYKTILARTYLMAGAAIAAASSHSRTPQRAPTAPARSPTFGLCDRNPSTAIISQKVLSATKRHRTQRVFANRFAAFVLLCGCETFAILRPSTSSAHRD